MRRLNNDKPKEVLSREDKIALLKLVIFLSGVAMVLFAVLSLFAWLIATNVSRPIIEEATLVRHALGGGL